VGNTATIAGSEMYNDGGTAASAAAWYGAAAFITGALCGAGNLSTDPKLAALANHGGFTDTMALQAGSSAINAGNDAACSAAPVSALDQDGDAGLKEHTAISARTSSSGPRSRRHRGGAKLNYVDGFTKADGAGDYSFLVPANWSGTVTPKLKGCTFTPVNRTYSNQTADAGSEDYAANCSRLFKSKGGHDGWLLESGENTNVGGSMDSAATTFNLGDAGGDEQYRASCRSIPASCRRMPCWTRQR